MLIRVVCDQEIVHQLLVFFEVGSPDDDGLIDAPKGRQFTVRHLLEGSFDFDLRIIITGEDSNVLPYRVVIVSLPEEEGCKILAVILSQGVAKDYYLVCFLEWRDYIWRSEGVIHCLQQEVIFFRHLQVVTGADDNLSVLAVSVHIMNGNAIYRVATKLDSGIVEGEDVDEVTGFRCFLQGK